MTAQTFPTPELVPSAEQNLAVVREVVDFEHIRDLYDRAYPLIFASLERSGTAPAGPPLGVTHGAPGRTLDLSVAVPVALPFEADGEVRPETIPEGTAATLVVHGDYSLLGDAYEHLLNWMAEQHLTPSGLAWEEYLTEPEPGGDPADNRTRIAVLLA